ncbi:MAG TPA: Uma2 family endonuclease [Tepidisphaeraceae bacterium]|jgi:Uma2 family endonuclease|nr:Uma2 family endonuclease [Tepidisphaeraceae bacterium]
MADVITSSRPFEPGTTGWSAANFADPRFAHEWDEGRYEIVEGVLTKMPPPVYFGNKRLLKLIEIISRHLEDSGQAGSFAPDVDVILQESRIVRADAVFLTPEDERRHCDVNAALGIDEELGRLRVPPTLIIESISKGHELHDRRTKRQWYAEGRIPNYWILDVYQRMLECLVLDGAVYRVDQSGSAATTVRPRLFPGLEVKLTDVWG